MRTRAVAQREKGKEKKLTQKRRKRKEKVGI